MTEQRIGKVQKEQRWIDFTDTVKQMGGSIIEEEGVHYTTHKLLGLTQEEFNFILSYIR
jgi:uncharacterized HAD superfamily protein